MPRRTLKRSNKAKNKTRSRKQCGGIGYVFGYTKEENDKNFSQFYKDLGLGYRGIKATNYDNVVKTVRKLKKNWVKYDINDDSELTDRLIRKKYNIKRGIVAILIDYGLDVNKPNKFGHTFLYNALQHGDKDLKIAKYLIDREGTDLHVTTNAGTYLHALARNKNSVNTDGSINKEIGEVITYLMMNKGINKDKVDKHKKNFLYYIKIKKARIIEDAKNMKELEEQMKRERSKQSSRASARPSPSSTRRASPSAGPSTHTRRASPLRSPSLKLDGDTPDSVEVIVDKINKYTTSTNPYKVLGLKESNSAEAKKAYKKLALKIHPDKCLVLDDHGDNKCQRAFNKVNDAYEEILNPKPK